MTPGARTLIDLERARRARGLSSRPRTTEAPAPTRLATDWATALDVARLFLGDPEIARKLVWDE